VLPEGLGKCSYDEGIENHLSRKKITGGCIEGMQRGRMC